MISERHYDIEIYMGNLPMSILKDILLQYCGVLHDTMQIHRYFDDGPIMGDGLTYVPKSIFIYCTYEVFTELQFKYSFSNIQYRSYSASEKWWWGDSHG